MAKVKDPETTAANKKRRQINRRGSSLAKHHVAAARVSARSRVAQVGAHNQVEHPIPIDITRRRHCVAAFVTRRLTVDDKASGASRHRRQIDRTA